MNEDYIKTITNENISEERRESLRIVMEYGKNYQEYQDYIKSLHVYNQTQGVQSVQKQEQEQNTFHMEKISDLVPSATKPQAVSVEQQEVSLYLVTEDVKGPLGVKIPQVREYQVKSHWAERAARKYTNGRYKLFIPTRMHIAEIIFYSIIETASTGWEIRYIPFDLSRSMQSQFILSIINCFESYQQAKSEIIETVPRCQEISLKQLETKVRLASASFELQGIPK